MTGTQKPIVKKIEKRLKFFLVIQRPFIFGIAKMGKYRPLLLIYSPNAFNIQRSFKIKFSIEIA